MRSNADIKPVVKTTPNNTSAHKKGVERKATDRKERRIVIVNHDKCKPKSEAFQYLQRHAGGCGKFCIQVDRTGPKPYIRISEDACEACMLRANRCPGGAVNAVRVPTDLDKNTTHRYGLNQFKLCGLPMPRRGTVLGILGSNGIGKSTALRILAGTLKPNLGDVTKQCTWGDIVRHYRGCSVQNYFIQIAQDELVSAVKPQLDAARFKAGTKRTVADVLTCHDARGVSTELCQKLDLGHLLDRHVDMLSGGEQQRLMIASVAAREADVYIFDEPSSFLDTKQRLAVAEVIRSLCSEDKYVIVVEHDLTLLDAISDSVCCLFGQPGAWGAVTTPQASSTSINQFLQGYFPALNMRFRPEALNFTLNCDTTEHGAAAGHCVAQYEDSEYVLESEEVATKFTLHVEAGQVHAGEVVVLLGENGCGKSTLLSCLTRSGAPLEGASLKQQHNSDMRSYPGTVATLLEESIGQLLGDRMFGLLVTKPLQITALKDKFVAKLSGGELQRVAITICLGTLADAYLLDEPSAGLDCEQRIVVANVIQRWVRAYLQKTAIVIEHDLFMVSTLANRIICFSGEPGVDCTASSPMGLTEGLEGFLRSLDVTMREDSHSGRPRLNGRGTCKDKEQKKAGNYYIRRSSVAQMASKDAPDTST